jgi:hypothetical protein
MDAWMDCLASKGKRKNLSKREKKKAENLDGSNKGV